MGKKGGGPRDQNPLAYDDLSDSGGVLRQCGTVGGPTSAPSPTPPARHRQGVVSTPGTRWSMGSRTCFPTTTPLDGSIGDPVSGPPGNKRKRLSRNRETRSPPCLDFLVDPPYFNVPPTPPSPVSVILTRDLTRPSVSTPSFLLASPTSCWWRVGGTDPRLFDERSLKTDPGRPPRTPLSTSGRPTLTTRALGRVVSPGGVGPRDRWRPRRTLVSSPPLPSDSPSVPVQISGPPSRLY